MLDTIKNIFRHPAFDVPDVGDLRAFGAFRPIRTYAPDQNSWVQRQCALYDFDKHGGATGTINLNTVSSGRPLGISFPAGAMILAGFVVVETLFAGATATIGLGVTGGGGYGTVGVLGATAVASFDEGAVLPLVQTYAGAGEIALPLSAAGDLSVEIATAALTAGKMLIVVEWYGNHTG